jgi:hypothetical protein
MKYTLVRTFDCNDTVDFEASDDEDPCSVALELLGWSIVAVKEDDGGNFDKDQLQLNLQY